MEWRPSVDQEEPGSPHIKEEEVEVCIKPEGGAITAVTVKREEAEEKPASSQLYHQGHPEENGEDCGEPELGPVSESEAEDSSETDHSLDYGQTFADSSFVLHHHNPHLGLSCCGCGKLFFRKGDLNRHVRIHTGEKPFSCSECKKRFRLKSHLRSHERIHREGVDTGDQEFSCCGCGQRFINKRSFDRRVISHSGEKPFRCAERGKTFGRNYTLRLHEKIHSGEKPFSCSECGKTFRHKNHLRSHEIIHYGEKPFSCSECGKTFRFKSHLRSHDKIHTDD